MFISVSSCHSFSTYIFHLSLLVSFFTLLLFILNLLLPHSPVPTSSFPFSSLSPLILFPSPFMSFYSSYYRLLLHLTIFSHSPHLPVSSSYIHSLYSTLLPLGLFLLLTNLSLLRLFTFPRPSSFTFQVQTEGFRSIANICFILCTDTISVALLPRILSVLSFYHVTFIIFLLCLLHRFHNISILQIVQGSSSLLNS